MKIDLDNLDDLALGTAFISTGGGGDPYLYQLALEAVIEEKGPVSLIDPGDLDDDATIMSMGGVGAPMIGSEKLPNGLEGVYAIRRLEEYANVKADALIAAEIGGGNGLVPLITSLHTGIPVVDADGMGRAYPATQMETFSIYGISATPMSAVDEFGNGVVITASDSITAERIVRQVGLAMGGHCMAADHIMSGNDVKKYAIRNTVTLSTGLGAAVRRATGRSLDEVDAEWRARWENSGLQWTALADEGILWGLAAFALAFGAFGVKRRNRRRLEQWAREEALRDALLQMTIQRWRETQVSEPPEVDSGPIWVHPLPTNDSEHG